MSEYRINSADISIRCDATVDDLIDVLEACFAPFGATVFAEDNLANRNAIIW